MTTIRRLASSGITAGFVAALAIGSAGCAKMPNDSAGIAGGDVPLREPIGKVDTEAFVCSNTTDAGGFTFDKIAVWRDDAKAAYTMIHDDMCGRELRGIDRMAVPALNRRGLVAAMGPFVDACAADGLWGMVQAVEKEGIEIINHSYSHPTITMQNVLKEVMLAKAEFDAKITKPVSFFIFPFDFWTADTVAMVEMAGHIGARAGLRDDNDGFTNPPLNPPEPMNDMAIEFDVWPRTYSKYAAFPEKDILNLHVYYAIEHGAFAVREFHSVTLKDSPEVAGEGFGPVPLRQYEDHLDFLVQAWKSNKVWTSTPSTIIRYRHARTACKASVAGDKITYDTSSEECTKFATPISVIVKTGNDLGGLKATQNGEPVFTRKIAANTFSVTADPTKGEVSLGGCADAGPAVDTGVTMPERPQPAKSVCDLQQVVGKGSPGMMDNLERSNDVLQILPNPAQGDGRNGSWSWYPGNASVKIMQDGRYNNAIRYTGGNHMRWSGVTLAFMGGNGAGACYDGSAYKGIRFRLKGFVEDKSLADKVIVSIVTAETQTRRLGGDLDGDGGHFHKVAPITGEWQTFEMTWPEFETPTFGASMKLKELAVKKMQAVDWGVSNTATRYEVWVDDIELF